MNGEDWDWCQYDGALEDRACEARATRHAYAEGVLCHWCDEHALTPETMKRFPGAARFLTEAEVALYEVMRA